MPDNGTVPLAILWDCIRWDKIESEVYRIQTRIVKYLKQGKLWQVKKLQRLLKNSYHAILLAIKRVTSNKGKRTAGVDGKVIRTPGQKIRIESLNIKGDIELYPSGGYSFPKRTGRCGHYG